MPHRSRRSLPIVARSWPARSDPGEPDGARPASPPCLALRPPGARAGSGGSPRWPRGCPWTEWPDRTISLGRRLVQVRAPVADDAILPLPERAAAPDRDDRVSRHAGRDGQRRERLDALVPGTHVVHAPRKALAELPAQARILAPDEDLPRDPDQARGQGERPGDEPAERSARGTPATSLPRWGVATNTTRSTKGSGVMNIERRSIVRVSSETRSSSKGVSLTFSQNRVPLSTTASFARSPPGCAR